MKLLRGASIVNHRQAGESFLEYKARLRFVHKVIKSALKGRYATHSRAKPFREKHFIGRMIGTGEPRKYVPGPHPTHKPHEVITEGFRMSPLGVPEPHTYRVVHPGTLVKE